MPKYYNVEWTARISGTVEIEAESEADATSKFKASPEAYTDDDQERPYESDHTVDRVDFYCETNEPIL